MKNLVSIIIVNWNGAKVLPECLESLLRLNHKDFEIVVVDNGSIDDSVNIIKKICGGKARVVCLEKNVGFAAGVNIGVENAKGEFIATINNDMVVEPSWLDQPLEFMLKDNKIGIVSCRQMNYYERSKIDSLFHCITKSLALMPIVTGQEYSDNNNFHSRSGYVMSANGGSAVIRTDVFRELGGYDADFFGYMEETDFCMRAFLNGWRCVYAPSAVVYHMEGFSFKKNSGYKYYLLERNRVWFLYKNIPAADILKNLHYILVRELLALKDSLLKHKNIFLYFKAKRDAFRKLRRYKDARKKNIALFKHKKREYYQLKKYKRLEF